MCAVVLCQLVPSRQPVPESEHPRLSPDAAPGFVPAGLVMGTWIEEGRGDADKIHWVSGQTASVEKANQLLIFTWERHTPIDSFLPLQARSGRRISRMKGDKNWKEVFLKF